MPTINSLISTNSSGVPGLRLNRRRGYEVIDVMWNDENGQRRSTSYLIKTAGALSAVERAMATRQAKTAVPYDITPRQAWLRLKKSAKVRTRGRRRG